MDDLRLLYRTLIEQTDTAFIRYLQRDIDWNSRIISIVGARGTGKPQCYYSILKTT